jgi:formate C-acetyltransferase
LPFFGGKTMVQRGKYNIVSYQAIVAQCDTTLVLKVTAGVDKYVFSYGDVFPEICVERRKHPERGINRFSEQAGKQVSDLGHGMICTVEFKCDAACFVAGPVHEFIDLRCVQRLTLFYMLKKSFQYENDDLMREVRNSDDYGIACCVSYQDIGRHIQFFGARCNLAKALLLAINGGRCENTGTLMVKDIPVLSSDVLNFEEVLANYKKVLKEMARVYNEAMNIIHYMHDKYYYEKAQMAFVDTDPVINLAYGVAGMSIAVDSLSAIKYAKVTARRNDIGLTEGFDIEGEFPCFGNDDDRVDHLAVDLIYYFDEELKKLPVYKHAKPTLSILTITSNVMYGKKTGATPDGRAKGVAFAPGANPMHGRDKNGAIASLSSVAKLRYRDSQDGISNTFSIVPKSLGVDMENRIENLVTMMDGYFVKGAHHLNVNVLNREMLEDAMEHPEKYPQLTIRVSGYAVNFIKLSREHQLEVISRSFHERM